MERIVHRLRREVASPVHTWIDVEGGERLAVDVHLPSGARGRALATLVEALPYRKDDVTASYVSSYERYVEAGFAVVRVDLRGTGSSTGHRRPTSTPTSSVATSPG
jgi:uncharacterized protein